MNENLYELQRLVIARTVERLKKMREEILTIEEGLNAVSLTGLKEDIRQLRGVAEANLNHFKGLTSL
jgi:hypothetical protein